MNIRNEYEKMIINIQIGIKEVIHYNKEGKLWIGASNPFYKSITFRLYQSDLTLFNKDWITNEIERRANESELIKFGLITQLSISFKRGFNGNELDAPAFLDIILEFKPDNVHIDKEFNLLKDFTEYKQIKITESKT